MNIIINSANKTSYSSSTADFYVSFNTPIRPGEYCLTTGYIPNSSAQFYLVEIGNIKNEYLGSSDISGCFILPSGGNVIDLNNPQRIVIPREMNSLHVIVRDSTGATASYSTNNCWFILERQCLYVDEEEGKEQEKDYSK